MGVVVVVRCGGQTAGWWARCPHHCCPHSHVSINNNGGALSNYCSAVSTTLRQTAVSSPVTDSCLCLVKPVCAKHLISTAGLHSRSKLFCIPAGPEWGEVGVCAPPGLRDGLRFLAAFITVSRHVGRNWDKLTTSDPSRPPLLASGRCKTDYHNQDS